MNIHEGFLKFSHFQKYQLKYSSNDFLMLWNQLKKYLQMSLFKLKKNLYNFLHF